jgi:hypothetical protein
MSQRIAFTAILLGAALGLGGCKFLKKKTPDPEPTVAAAPASAAPAAVVAAPAPSYAAPVAPVAAVEPLLDENAIPAPQDFEDEAFEKVTTANFKAELARLNKEIAAPPAP